MPDSAKPNPKFVVALSHESDDVLWNSYHDENLLDGKGDRKKYIGDKENRFCRFCHQDATQTTFKSDAHLLPEFMDNNILFSYFECDSCNALFSRYETSFANYFNIHHTLNGVRGKQGVPKYKYNAFNPEVIFKENVITINESTGGNIKINDDTMSFAVNRPAYIPQHVVKCLVKIGFCLIPDMELQFYEQTRKWLIEEIKEDQYVGHPFLSVFYNIGGGLIAKNPFAVLLSRNPHAVVPYSTLLVGYSGFKFQIFMPFNSRDIELWSKPIVKLPIEKHIVRLNKTKTSATVLQHDFSATDKVVGEIARFSVGVEDGKFYGAGGDFVSSG